MSRKGCPYSRDEIALIRKMREQDGAEWPQIALLVPRDAEAVRKAYFRAAAREGWTPLVANRGRAWPDWASGHVVRRMKDGVSARDVAHEITTRGFKVSKNAVLGKWQRYREANGIDPREAGGKCVVDARAMREAPPRPVFGPIADLLADPSPNIVTVANGRCRFIAEEAAESWRAHVCNANALPGGAWCEHHRSIVYLP